MNRQSFSTFRWIALLAFIFSGLSVFSTSNPTQAADKVKVFLSNNYMGNDWRVQMVNTAEAVAKKEPFASRFDFKVINVENSPEAQSASIDNMIDQGAKAILID